MGCIGFGGKSSSSYDKPQVVEKVIYKSPNPDPKNCTINFYYEFGNYQVVGIHYPDCTTFEGNKILVYKYFSIEKFNRQMQIAGIDPHFSSNKMYYSPIARFIPTEEGMQIAKDFARMLNEQENK